ncbi:MAG: MATE family efflux transporter [Muribaculaceae bacterium]
MADIKQIQTGEQLDFRQRLALTAKLSWPAMMAQLSSILMQYIDTAMVGRLGADDSASIGLVSTSLWLFWGTCSAAMAGFSVQTAHRMGSGDYAAARRVLRQGLISAFLFGLAVAIIGIAIAVPLPGWLGGQPSIQHGATLYFFVFVAALPVLTLNYFGSAMLRAAGSMKVAGGLNVLMCVLDVIFNFFFIFDSNTYNIWGLELHFWGAGWGLMGAALGTVTSIVITAGLVLWYLTCREKDLAIWGRRCLDKASERVLRAFRPTRGILSNALKVSAPMAMEHAVLCGAQIAVTIVVAPLGVMAIAANAFAVTAESLCYMPGFGIGDAATTLVGQSYGAGRKDLARQFGMITVGLGMTVMSLMGIVMYIFAPEMMEMLSPVSEIQQLGYESLRIEAWAEPMFAAAIVSYGVMVGVGDTMLPACMNFGSIWLVRLPLAALLAPTMGLQGVWLAMCIELCFRGAIFLWRLFSGAWLKHGLKAPESPTPTAL